MYRALSKELSMPSVLPAHLKRLEAESIHIMREVVAEMRNPVMLYSIGKDSSAMLHVAMKAFYPAKPPFPLLHVDTTWKFREMIAFRDETARRLGLDLIVHINQEGVMRGISPVASGSQLHTQVMKTESLRQALDSGRFDAAFGGARRDEEKSRAKERIFSHRSAAHAWDPRNQRPELWRLFNTRIREGESLRVFPLSNWTELDVWEYMLPRTFRLCRFISPSFAPSSSARRSHHGRRRSVAAHSRRTADNAARSLPHTRLLSADGAMNRKPTRSATSSPKCAKRPPPSARAASSITTKPHRWKRKSAKATSDECCG